jgi:hypothetical protein
MTRIPHPDPLLARLGRTLSPGAPSLEPARVTKKQAERVKTRSSLTDIFPTFVEAITGGFSEIAIPALTFSALTAGYSGWYPLIDLSIEDVGQELLLFGYTLTQSSTDSTTVTNAVWGDKRGESAAIVIGDGRLPITGINRWVQAPCSIPGIEATTAGKLVQSDRGKYIAWHKFPQGNYGDAIPFKTNLPRQFAPFVWRFGFGTRIQVALVVRGTQIQAGAGKTLFGDCSIQLHMGATVTTQKLTV